MSLSGVFTLKCAWIGWKAHKNSCWFASHSSQYRHTWKQNPASSRFLLFTTVVHNYACFSLASSFITLPYSRLFVCLGWLHLSGNYDSVMMMSAAAAQHLTTTVSVCVCGFLNIWLGKAVKLPVQRTSTHNTKLMVQLMKNIWLMKNTPSDASRL